MGPERVSDLFGALYRRRLTILFVVAGAVGGSFFFSRFLPKQYKAEAALFIPANPPRLSLNSEAINIPSGPMVPDIREETHIGLVALGTTGAVYEKVAELIPGVDARRLRKNLKVDVDRNKQLVVTAWDQKAVRAAELANTGVRAVAELIQEMSERGPRSTLAVLEAREPDAWGDYRHARDAMVVYLDSIESPDLEVDISQLFTDRRRYEDALRAIESEVRQAAAERPVIEQMIEARPEFSLASKSFGRNAVYQGVLNQLADLQVQIAVERLRFEPAHNVILGLQERKRVLEEQAEVELERGLMVQTGATETLDEQARSLMNDLMQMDVAAASVEARRQIFRERLARVEERLQAVPLNRAEMQPLQEEINRTRRLAEDISRRIYELRLQLERGLDFTWVDERRLATEQEATLIPSSQGVIGFASVTGVILGVLLALAMELISQMRRTRPF